MNPECITFNLLLGQAVVLSDFFLQIGIFTAHFLNTSVIHHFSKCMYTTPDILKTFLMIYPSNLLLNAQSAKRSIRFCNVSWNSSTRWLIAWGLRWIIPPDEICHSIIKRPSVCWFVQTSYFVLLSSGKTCQWKSMLHYPRQIAKSARIDSFKISFPIFVSSMMHFF